jgi:hypothetical protein
MIEVEYKSLRNQTVSVILFEPTLIIFRFLLFFGFLLVVFMLHMIFFFFQAVLLNVVFFVINIVYVCAHLLHLRDHAFMSYILCFLLCFHSLGSSLSIISPNCNIHLGSCSVFSILLFPFAPCPPLPA